MNLSKCTKLFFYRYLVCMIALALALACLPYGKAKANAKVKANHFFDSTEMPSPQRYYAEPSLSQCRALADSMPNLRQLVESPKTLQ